MRLIFCSFSIYLSVLSLCTVPAAFAVPPCTGGSCTTPTGIELSCPSGGSLECGKKECCKCYCHPEEGGGYSPVNICDDCPDPKVIRSELLEEIELILATE